MIYPKVFKVLFEDDTYHRVSTCGGMDSEFSHITRDQNAEYVVAPDLETAQFLWNHKNRGIKTRTDIKWKELGNVNILLANGFGIN